MNEMPRNQYVPDTVSPPGETLQEILEDRGMSQAELSERAGRPKKTVNEIIKGKAAITPETAIQLERVLGVSAEFWNNRERQYREYLARRQEEEQLASSADWVGLFPYSSMEKRGWVRATKSKLERAEALLAYFAVASPGAWREVWRNAAPAFKRSQAFQTSEAALAAWLRRGEIVSTEVAAAAFDPKCFQQLLPRARKLTREADALSTLAKDCASCGVVLAFVPELPGTHVWGATRWLPSSRPLIQLSLRYKTDDHFWFTFFHECGHVLVHGKREVFVESDDIPGDPTKEREADDFARNTLIPETALRAFLRKRVLTSTAIRQFAYEIGVAPGIVVGRLQHDELLPPAFCNDLKRPMVMPNE
jgi:HTH-type transcriptional regulator / antitoxin HigA